MKILNYALAGGNKTLLQVQAVDSDMLFQLWYTGLTSTTVSVEVWISTISAGPYSKVPSASYTLIPADNTAHISLSGLSYAFVEFRLVAASATAGTISQCDVMNGVNPE